MPGQQRDFPAQISMMLILRGLPDALGKIRQVDEALRRTRDAAVSSKADIQATQNRINQLPGIKTAAKDRLVKAGINPATLEVERPDLSKRYKDLADVINKKQEARETLTGPLNIENRKKALAQLDKEGKLAKNAIDYQNKKYSEKLQLIQKFKIEEANNKPITESNRAEQQKLEKMKMQSAELEKQRIAQYDYKNALRDMSREWAFTAYTLQTIVARIQQAAEASRSLEEARIFSGRKISNNIYGNTAFGTSIADTGNMMKQAARSFFPAEFEANITRMSAFQSMLGGMPEDFVSIVGGFKAMYGGAKSMSEIMDTLLNISTRTNFNFSGWASIVMQGAVPQTQELNVSLEETGALLGGIANMGGGPFASGFGLTGILSMLSAPKKDQQKVLSMLGLKDMNKTIRQEGLLNTLQLIKDKLAGLSETARDSAIAKLFPSMGKGVALMLLNNMDQFKALRDELQVGGGKQKMLEGQLMPLNQLKEMGALWNNTLSQLTSITTKSATFQGVMAMVLGTLRGINSVVIEINKSPFLKAVVGGILGVGAVGGVISLVARAARDIKTLQKLFLATKVTDTVGGAGGLISGINAALKKSLPGPTAWVSGVKQGVIGSGILPILGQVAMGVGILAVIGMGIHEYLVRKDMSKAASIQKEQSRYEVLFRKSVKGTLTNDERIEYENLKRNITKRGNAGTIYKNNQEHNVNINVNVSGLENVDSKTSSNFIASITDKIADSLNFGAI